MQGTYQMAANGQVAPLPLEFETTPRFQATVSILREALEYARQLRRPVWDFAVEIQELREAGLTNSDLRLLVCQGLVEHASEIRGQGQIGRAFQRTGLLTFTKRTCFVLAKNGACADFNKPKACDSPEPLPEVLPPTADTPPIPHWDKERQELRVGELVVKQFKVPAPNQETVLASFEEEGWPPRIDDPLPPQPDQDSKRRLHDTITTLNRHHKHRLIRFCGDGSGEGIRWEALQFSPQRNGVH